MIDDDSDSIPYLKSRIRAPILWIIVPLVLGYAVARMTPGFSGLMMLVLGGVLSVVWMVAWFRRQYRRLHWRVVGVLSIFILSWGYLLMRLPPNLDWADKPEREVNLTVKVTQVRSLEDKYERLGGYGEIVRAPKHLESLVGQKVSFLLSPEDGRAGGLVRSEVIRVRGLLSSILQNTGNSFEDYLFSQGIGFKLKRGRILGRESGPSMFYRFCQRQNERLEAILARGKGKGPINAANIYSAMLLGNQASLTPEQKYAFRVTGSLHLFSISGLHVAMVAACIAFFLRLVRMPSVFAAIIGLCVLFLYVEITGGAPSAMRAFLMVAFYWGARAFRRKKSAFSALLASGLVALIVNPLDLFNIGFQLSYGVVGSILLYGVPLNEVVNNWINMRFAQLHAVVKYGLRWFFSLIGISLAANIGSVFLSILYFKTFAPGAVLLSIFVIPLASVVIVTGCVSLLLGLLGLSIVSGYINPLSWLIIKVMEMCIGFSLKIPGLYWESFTVLPICSYIGLGLVFVLLYWGHVLNKLQRSIFYSLPVGVIVLFVLGGRFLGSTIDNLF